MLLFLDTEYTGLGRAAPKLISIALVAEDGVREFYAELSGTWTPDDCTSFVKRHVLPLLTGPRLSHADARATLRGWFEQAPRNVRVACDSRTDWFFLLDLLGAPRPQNLANSYYDLRPLIDTAIYHSAVDAYYRLDAREHHALADARAYRRAWLAWMDARKTSIR
ncbi:3'-5' exoribonuclease [Burkholderia multivorans]|uniref:3'-5' exoribonuclease n=1 Tax=Burkholderia multivorans TaxID=87883 RepID=UPI0009C08EEE|nr:3'-5' exoribonuclease [Burkholderia multivorans]